ncbi:protein SYS1 homolog [Anopheles maculipalpis]|uniref:Protein SYS1 homolog n=2 Tax=Neocellia TaxID=44535 RepID=A0A182XVT2_ANOST|nr:protein SYS1 homolog [Anopheles stephensi]XP_050071731.1 protein SYS1 homolog [Anopheles maculipalpis]
MKKLTGTFRNTQWDPYLLITQIVAMQALLYVSLGTIMYVMDFFAEANHTLDHIFEYHEIHVTDLGGRLVIVAFILNSLVGAGLLWFIVRRTKLCLDFSFTFHFTHLVICWWYNEAFPSTIGWWMLNAVCTALMCVCSEFLCLKTELKEIPVGYTALNQKVDL